VVILEVANTGEDVKKITDRDKTAKIRGRFLPTDIFMNHSDVRDSAYPFTHVVQPRVFPNQERLAR
jgi:hypothetical protein